MVFSQMKQRLLLLDTACVCDADKEQGRLGVVDPAIGSVRRGLKLVGRAYTVRCHEDFLTVIKALRDAGAGEVIVIDSQNSRRALTGELFPTEARRKGLAGIVIDGPCRDTQTVGTLDLPYYARSSTPYAGTTTNLGETQVPVTCGGVTVHPGDVVLGDDDGLVFATVEELAAAVPIAEEIQRTEEIMQGRMAEGTSLLEMLNFESHCAALEASEPSSLRFMV